MGSGSPATWTVRSASHWNEMQNDPTEAQPTANESTLCWQQLLQREMSMVLLLPAISLSWWQPWPLLCPEAICFPDCWKARKYQETLQKWCTPWPCLIIICYETALSWRLRLPAAVAQLPAGSIWWLTRWRLVGAASVGPSHYWARSKGTAGSKVHRSLLFPCCSANANFL